MVMMRSANIFGRISDSSIWFFSFTSLGGKVDRCVPQGRGPKMFQLQGENYHLMGSLKPPAGEEAKFSQLYIVDIENEIDKRSSTIGYFQLIIIYQNINGYYSILLDVLILSNILILMQEIQEKG